MKKESLSKFTNQCAKKLNETGKFSTARAYNSALRSFSLFVGKEEVFFRDVNRFTLKAYNSRLFSQGHKPNTVSTYMRTLRSIYNQGVDLGLAEPVARLFHDVYTGIDVNCKKAISPQDMHTLLYKHPGDEKLKRVQEIAKLMFDFSGISFADIANLKTTNFRGNVLEYSRKKTRTRIALQLLPSSKPLMSQLKMQDAGNSNLFEFGILSGRYGTDTYDGYQEYQSKLHWFNAKLKRLARVLGLSCRVSSYTIRHTWATIAKRLGTPIEMISESLGHKSIKTTQIYLKNFDLEQLAEVNFRNSQYVKNIG